MLIMALALSSSNPPLFPLNRIRKTGGRSRREGGGRGEGGVAAVTEIDLGLGDRRTGCI